MKEGMFICLEGVDGSGKSTNAKLLVDNLNEAGEETILVREPGSTILGEKLRSLIKHDTMSVEVETLLLFAARKELVDTVIKPALAKGIHVITDRFTPSTYAYQVCGKGMTSKHVYDLTEMTIGYFHPDLYLVLNIPIEVSKYRISNRELDKFERGDVNFYKRVHGFYKTMYLDERYNVKVIDASLSKDAVAVNILREVALLIKVRRG